MIESKTCNPCYINCQRGNYQNYSVDPFFLFSEADIFDDILSFSEKEQSVVNTPEKIQRSVEITQRGTPGNQRIVIRTPG